MTWTVYQQGWLYLVRQRRVWHLHRTPTNLSPPGAFIDGSPLNHTRGVTLATALKDIIAIAQKIEQSFVKVSSSLARWELYRESLLPIGCSEFADRTKAISGGSGDFTSPSRILWLTLQSFEGFIWDERGSRGANEVSHAGLFHFPGPDR